MSRRLTFSVLMMCCLLGALWRPLPAPASEDPVTSFLSPDNRRLPPGFRLSRVMADAGIANQRAEVSLVNAALPAQVAVERVASFWRASAEAPVLEAQAGDWLMVSRLSPGQHEVLQIRAGGSSTVGFLTVWRTAGATGGALLERLLPEGLRPGSILQLREGPKLVTSAVVHANDGFTTSSLRLPEWLEQQGFRQVAQIQPADPNGAAMPPITRYRRGAQELTLVSGLDSSVSRFVITLSEPLP